MNGWFCLGKFVGKYTVRPMDASCYSGQNSVLHSLILTVRTWKGTIPIGNTWVFPKIVVPQNWWFTRENPIRIDDLGVFPLFFGNTHIFQPSISRCVLAARFREVKLRWVKNRGWGVSIWLGWWIASKARSGSHLGSFNRNCWWFVRNPATTHQFREVGSWAPINQILAISIPTGDRRISEPSTGRKSKVKGKKWLWKQWVLPTIPLPIPQKSSHK